MKLVTFSKKLIAVSRRQTKGDLYNRPSLLPEFSRGVHDKLSWNGAGSLNSECGPWRPEPREVRRRTFRREDAIIDGQTRTFCIR